MNENKLFIWAIGMDGQNCVRIKPVKFYIDWVGTCVSKLYIA